MAKFTTPAYQFCAQTYKSDGSIFSVGFRKHLTHAQMQEIKNSAMFMALTNVNYDKDTGMCFGIFYDKSNKDWKLGISDPKQHPKLALIRFEVERKNYEKAEVLHHTIDDVITPGLENPNSSKELVPIIITTNHPTQGKLTTIIVLQNRELQKDSENEDWKTTPVFVDAANGLIDKTREKIFKYNNYLEK